MKIRRLITTTLVISAFVLSMSACAKSGGEAEAKSSEASSEQAARSEQAAQIDEKNIFFDVNGTKVVIGTSYKDIKDKLGTEIAPEEKVGSCTGEHEYLKIIHVYTGFVVDENYDGIVSGVYLNAPESGNGDGKLFGQFGYGCAVKDVEAYIGQQIDVSSGYAECSVGPIIFTFESEDNTTLTGISACNFDLSK
jgi:hypothetical protein